MADLPKMIRVGYRDYRVESWPVREANADQRFGHCDRLNLVIRIREDLPSTMQAECLIHEVLHAAFESGCIGDSDGEEREVSILAHQLTQVWRDNPDFVAFMSAALSGEQANG